MIAQKLFRYLWREWVRPLALPILLITAAKASLADINYVPSGSMEPTIVPGDVVFIDKLAYDLRVPFTYARLAHWSDPGRGDVVVCYEPNDGTRLVKRVIGLPGDVLEMRQDRLFVNGAAVSYAPAAPEIVHDLSPREREAAVFAIERLGDRRHAMMALPGRPALRNFGPVTVPACEYFMMGDNRDDSRDSRYFGFMPRARIIGRVEGVFVSADYRAWLRPRLHRFFSGLE